MNSDSTSRLIPLRQQSWPEGTQPVVSVFSWVYNHSPYIRQSIDSILDQETNFPVEIIIHDDASNDGTAEIICEYEKRYPNLFRNILQKENQYSQGKCLLQPLVKFPKGKFIALTHGDDFWIDPQKLFKQRNLLESNSQIVLAGHRFILASATSSHVELESAREKQEGSLEDILFRNYVHTATGMFRNGILSENLLKDAPDAGDWFIWVQLAKFGNIGFINEIMSAYRIHAGGVASGLPIPKKIKSIKASISRLHKDFGSKYKIIKRRSLAEYHIQCAEQCVYSNTFKSSIYGAWLIINSFFSSPAFAYREKRFHECLTSHLKTIFFTRQLLSTWNRFSHATRKFGSRLKKLLLCGRAS